jgi:transposase
MEDTAVLLFEDETILRLFPELRRSWSLRGEQAAVTITGENDRLVLFGAINIRTGHCIVERFSKMNQEGFHAFMRRLRRSYPGRQIWLLLDEASCHTAPKSQVLAEELDIKLVWLPKQCPELNGVDHLWRSVKRDISSNYQFESVVEQACYAETYILALSKKQVQSKAGILSKNFWLKIYL